MRKARMTQYVVDFPSEPALHARLVRLLIREKIDFKSMVAVRKGSKTTIQFLAPSGAALRDRLKNMGISAHEKPRKPAKTRADKDIGVHSLYGVVEGDNMRIVLAVDRPADAAALIEKLGYEPDPAFYD